MICMAVSTQYRRVTDEQTALSALTQSIARYKGVVKFTELTN